ncbi:hypothetical protein ACFQ1S_38160 [Kibdelosporangium lantanae]|uniref:Uncharacterized protein n=1 Tax=Kibdelosporangium lantanae TaxID=1497396 RepID=A0ABW3MJY9_9PSEU
MSVDEDSFAADVLNGFSLDNGRHRPTPGPRLAPAPPDPDPVEETRALERARAEQHTNGHSPE